MHHCVIKTCPWIVSSNNDCTNLNPVHLLDMDETLELDNLINKLIGINPIR